jgi:hypothetical protein
MSTPFAVQESTALALIQFHLSGFRGYPPSEMGEKVFARGLQECTISVDHATAVVKKFDERFPTLREIIDTAVNLKPQFEHLESPQQAWQREYGKTVPFSMNAAAADETAMHWQAIRDALYYTEGPGDLELEKISDAKQRRKDRGFWQDAMAENQRNFAHWVEQVRAELAQFGWDNLMFRFAPYKPEDWGPIAARWAAEREMWSAIKAKLGKDFSEASWAVIYQIKKDLGYPLGPEEEKILAKAS